jgi:hypothetical protein
MSDEVFPISFTLHQPDGSVISRHSVRHHNEAQAVIRSACTFYGLVGPYERPELELQRIGVRYDGPHVRIEYDLAYEGGDYSVVGQFAYVPASLVEELVDLEAAFEAMTGYDRNHIIHYSPDELYDAEGNLWEGDES